MIKLDMTFWLNRIIEASDDLSCPYCKGKLMHFASYKCIDNCKCSLCDCIMKYDNDFDDDLEEYTTIDYMEYIREIVLELKYNGT